MVAPVPMATGATFLVVSGFVFPSSMRRLFYKGVRVAVLAATSVRVATLVVANVSGSKGMGFRVCVEVVWGAIVMVSSAYGPVPDYLFVLSLLPHATLVVLNAE